MPHTAEKPVLPSVDAKEGADAILCALADAGCVRIRNFLSKDQVRELNTEIDPAIAKLQAGSTNKDEWTKEFHGRNTKRLTNLTTISKTFREAILNMNLFYNVCDKVFLEDSGTYWLNTALVIQIGPGNKAQQLHREQQQFPVFDLLGPEGPEATINFLVALTEFTDENGATRVIPGSHKWADFSNYGTADDTIPAEMDAGDAFLINGKIVHGGGANRTADFHRRGLALSVQCSYLTPEEAYPFTTPMEVVRTMSPRAQRMIAFRSQYPKASGGLWMHNYSELADHLGLDDGPGEDVPESRKAF